jgi:hypothetical protein
MVVAGGQPRGDLSSKPPKCSRPPWRISSSTSKRLPAFGRRLVAMDNDHIEVTSPLQWAERQDRRAQSQVVARNAEAEERAEEAELVAFAKELQRASPDDLAAVMEELGDDDGASTLNQ